MRQPEWVRSLTKYFTENPKVFLLFQYFQQNATVIISIDDFKGERRSGGSLINDLECGIHIISDYNLSFGQIFTIKSYRAEVYVSIVATPFLHLYSTYYLVKVNKKSMHFVIIKHMLIH